MASKVIDLDRVGDSAFSRVEKIRYELFTLTYGALITQLIRDYEDVGEVNEQLEKMGYNIGMRLIEEFLAKSGVPFCSDFRETAEVIGKVAFKMFLGISAEVTHWNEGYTQCSLIISDNPLTDFVELPPHLANLSFCNLLCGVIRGALEMVQMRVQCDFVRDVLHGDDVSEIRLELLEMLEDQAGDEYKEGM